jgi:hypothetical protein
MDQLQIKYAELFSLSIEQLFYQNKICKKYQVSPVLDLQIKPIAESQQIMQQMDLIFRNTDENGGFIILAGTRGKNAAGNDLVRSPAGGNAKLVFGIILKNPEVINFNDLPTELISNGIYYFNNEVNDNTAPRDALHLSKDATGVSGINDVAKRVNTAYHFHAAGPVAEGAALVQHILTGQTIEPVSLINQAGEADINFDLTHLPSGECQLLINGTSADSFYYAGNFSIEPVFGIIEILLSPAISSNYRIIEPDGSLTPDRPLFIIRFKNRKTIWRYTFYLQPNSPLYQEITALNASEKADFLEKLNVVSNDASVSFKQSNITDTVLTFESANPLLLQENYFLPPGINTSLHLMLKKYIGASNESVVRDNLPYPSTRFINATVPPSVYSDIFITI